jgi:hypothetical protein
MFATTQSGVPALLAAERNTFIAPAITCRHVNDVSMPATYETPEQGSEQTREQTVEEVSEQTYQDISEEGHDEMFDQDPDYLSPVFFTVRSGLQDCQDGLPWSSLVQPFGWTT